MADLETLIALQANTLGIAKTPKNLLGVTRG